MTGDEELPRERRLSGWTTRRWLRVGVAGSLAVLAVLGATGAWVLGRTASLSDTLVNVKSPALSTSFRLESALLNQETGIRGYGLTGTPDFLKPYQQGLADQATYTTTLSRLVGGDDAESADLRRVQDAVEKWQARIARPIAATPAGVASPLASERAAEGKTDFDALRAAMARQQERLRTDQARAREDLAATMRLRNWVFIAIALVIVALAGLIFEAMRRGVTKPLERLGRDARSVTDGDFTRPIVATGPADLRRLSGEIDSMRQRLVRELEVSEQARHHLDTQAAELQRSNAELEQFAYVASHDLQEPLRKVSSFTQLLQRRYAGQLDAKADQYIAFAVDGANRMQTLINDLLDFSRVGRVHHTHESVALDAVVERAVSALAVSIEETGAEISCEELPTLVADPTQMGMLWQNLIGNAVKFHRPGQPPHIHVSAAREGAVWRFSVTDDGIGIAPEYAEKVFVIFQRLHTKDAYSGSGIGLAMCKKIVEFHGGTIAVDQEYTGGTRITFTLAEAPPATAGPLPASELPRGEGPLGRGAGERPTAVRSGTEPTP
ncbi:ATP-binding protein [Streptomyces xanthochromogenes]|uniref:sensor histidine kinase n=1 Tax=Streptomyces xanthochromogenes TaxID=67384 RepID=UPI00381741BA